KDARGLAVRDEALVLRLQLFSRFLMFRVQRNAGDGTDLLTLRLIEMPDAFSAARRIDFVDLGTHVDGVVRAHRFAHIAVDAFVGDHQRHDYLPLLLSVQPSWRSASRLMACTTLG